MCLAYKVPPCTKEILKNKLDLYLLGSSHQVWSVMSKWKNSTALSTITEIELKQYHSSIIVKRGLGGDIWTHDVSKQGSQGWEIKIYELSYMVHTTWSLVSKKLKTIIAFLKLSSSSCQIKDLPEHKIGLERVKDLIAKFQGVINMS